MTSGGVKCGACMKIDCICLPEAVTNSEPTCPHCGQEYHTIGCHKSATIVCGCGYNFESEKIIIWRSRPL